MRFSKFTTEFFTRLKCQSFKLFFIFIIFISSCKENDIGKVKSMFNEKDADVEVADSVRFTYKEGAYARAVVTGKTIRRFTKTQNKIFDLYGVL